MFEKFTAQAREAVVAAQETARSSGAHAIDSRHLLLALLDQDGVAPRALRQVGVEPATFAGALRAELEGGLDASVARVRRHRPGCRPGASADAVFGEGALERARRAPRKGHLPFAADGKKALELSLREAVRLHTRRIDGQALLLGLLRGTGSPAEVALQRAVTEAGSDVDALRAAVEGPWSAAS